MQIAFALLLPSLIWLGYTTLILLLNLKDVKPVRRSLAGSTKRVSVLIPARNEEICIGTCVASLLDQSYENVEVIVLDDQSTDRTASILASFDSSKLKVIHGSTKPADWLGKPWACHQLSQAATGDILIFADADTWFARDAIASVADSFDDHTDMITIWPIQKLVTFWERIVIPMVYFSLFTLLPSRYVSDDPKWMPRVLRPRFRPLFAAACGQFLAFTRSSYDRIGGHTSVKQDIVEDVQLAKAVKASGGTVRMHHGHHSVGCRMYRSHSEIWNGFRKNFLAGFEYNIPFFLLAAILHLWVYVIPFFLLPWAPIAALVCISIPILQRIILAQWYGMRWVDAFSHVIGVMWFQALGVRVLIDRTKGTKISWKGRAV